MKIIKALWVIAIVSMVLNGCSGYRLSSQSKNAIVDQISPDTFTVNFCGNAYMTQQDVEKYALQRASEASLAKGYSHFVVLEKRDNSELCEFKPGDQHGIEPVLQTKESPLIESSSFVKPNITLKIRAFSKGTKMQEKAINAEQFLRENFPGLKK